MDESQDHSANEPEHSMDAKVKKKRCSVCRKNLPLSDYQKKPDGKFGVNGRCKICLAENRRRYRGKYSQAKPRAHQLKEIVGKPEISREYIQYITKKHNRQLMMLDPKTAHTKSLCWACKGSTRCQARVQQGLWVLCEAPDQADLIRQEQLVDQTAAHKLREEYINVP